MLTLTKVAKNGSGISDWNRLPPKGNQFLAEIIDEDFTVSALSRDLSLITRNVEDFKKMKDLTPTQYIAELKAKVARNIR